MTWTGWREAWQEALYGADGFYRQPTGPAGHFATATQGAPALGSVLANALVRWIEQERLTTFVDVGCGRGELLAHVQARAPWLSCLGVDVIARPSSLPPGIRWLQSPGGPVLPEDLADLSDALVFANEWLDVVPCTVAQVQDGALREVLVEVSTGRERLGSPVDDADWQWCQRYWPTSGLADGNRVEVGLARDAAWVDLLGRLRSGLAVAVDYGHRRDGRPPAGTLTAFREGRQVTAVPDGSCDLTAHVAMDSLRCDELVDQRTALRRLGVSGSTPDHGLARRDPASYLRALSAASAGAALIARAGLGGFWWAISRVPH